MWEPSRSYPFGQNHGNIGCSLIISCCSSRSSLASCAEKPDGGVGSRSAWYLNACIRAVHHSKWAHPRPNMLSDSPPPRVWMSPLIWVIWMSPLTVVYCTVLSFFSELPSAESFIQNTTQCRIQYVWLQQKKSSALTPNILNFIRNH